MRKIVRFGAFGLIAAVAVGAGVAPAPARAETKLLFNFYLPRSTPFWVALAKPWIADVETKTQGRVKIEVPAAPMAGAKDTYNLVRKGAADLTVNANSFQVNVNKLPEITEIPFLSPTALGASVALWRTYQKFFKAAGEFKGMQPLVLWTLDDNAVQSTGAPILKIGDMNGKKMLAAPTQLRLVKALGGTPVVAPIGQYFEMLSGGIADGTVQVVGAAFHMKYGRYLKSITQFPGGLGRTAFMLLMNERTWKRLPAQDREIIASVSGEPAARRVGTALDEENAKTEPTLKKWGVKFYQADQAYIAAAEQRLGFIEEEWLAAAKERHVDGPAALAFFKKTVAEVNGAAKN